MFHFIFVIAVYYNLIKSGINNATRKNEQVLKIGIGMQLNIISLDLCEQLSFSRQTILITMEYFPKNSNQSDVMVSHSTSSIHC